MKICCRCKIEKPKAEFRKHSGNKDGLQYECRSCATIHYQENKEKYIKRAAIWNKENPEKMQECRQSWAEANKGRRSEKNMEWYKANKDRIAVIGKAWREDNPDKKAATNRNRRAIKRNADGKHTAADIRSIFDKQQGLCANCQTKLFKSGKQKYHVDHIMPLALGGSNWPSNLQCLCQSCNLRKWAKHPGEWAKENGRLI